MSRSWLGLLPLLMWEILEYCGKSYAVSLKLTVVNRQGFEIVKNSYSTKVFTNQSVYFRKMGRISELTTSNQ